MKSSTLSFLFNDIGLNFNKNRKNAASQLYCKKILLKYFHITKCDITDKEIIANARNGYRHEYEYKLNKAQIKFSMLISIESNCLIK